MRCLALLLLLATTATAEDATMKLDQLLDERETDPRTGNGGFRLLVALVEPLEDRGLKVLRDADTRVADA